MRLMTIIPDYVTGDMRCVKNILNSSYVYR